MIEVSAKEISMPIEEYRKILRLDCLVDILHDMCNSEKYVDKDDVRRIFGWANPEGDEDE